MLGNNLRQLSAINNLLVSQYPHPRAFHSYTSQNAPASHNAIIKNALSLLRGRQQKVLSMFQGQDIAVMSTL